MGEPNRKKYLDDSKEGLPSNEDVVESLVKDFSDVNVIDKENLNDSKNIPCTSSSSDDRVSGNYELNEDRDYDYDEEAGSTKKTDDKNDFIDEEHLKDLEVGYSDEERKVFFYVFLHVIIVDYIFFLI